MAKKAKTPSFIHEFGLVTGPKEVRILDVRFDAGRNLYNACLSEALSRLAAMRRSAEWKAARAMIPGKDRTAAFRSVNEAFGHSEYSLHKYAAKTCHACWIGEHIDSLTAQKVATRAFSAVKEYQFMVRGKPRFKRHGWMSSLEGKNNSSGIKWREGRVMWNGLELKCIIDRKDKHGVEAHALSQTVKYCRIVRKVIRGNTRWFVQLVLMGAPKIKSGNAIGCENVGLDIGPSTIAVVGDTDARLLEFCPDVDVRQKEIRLLQRKMDRSRRATNPDNYDKNGVVIRGKRKWNRSRKYRDLRESLSDRHRSMAESRSRSHGRLVNNILSLGTVVHTEKLSYRALQKQYGKSIGRRAPGGFIEILRRKAENAGGKLLEFPTRTTALSQTCHCGRKEKKLLSDRWHVCRNCGTVAQRDLYSAFLAKHVHEDILDIRQAEQAWPGAHLLLERAMSRVQFQAANGLCVPASFGLSRRQSRSPVKDGSMAVEVRDIVHIAEEAVKAAHAAGVSIAVRTP
jgi:transposase